MGTDTATDADVKLRANQSQPSRVLVVDDERSMRELLSDRAEA